MKNKKYILWDHDGILVVTEPLYYKANRTALSEIGISMSLEKYMEFMQSGKSVWNLASKKNISDEIIRIQKDKRNQYYQNYLATENIEIPGVVKVLTELNSRYRMAIITTSRRKDFELIHKNRSILSFMDFYLTLEDYQKAKPEPDPYLKGMQKFNALSKECVVIEDSARGLKSAIATGIDCIIIKNNFTKSHDFTGAKQIVDSIEYLLDML